MEHALACNNLKCRRELSDRALVTTCSHIFCQDCAHQLGMLDQQNSTRLTCPACKVELVNPDDAVLTNLNPTEDYKTSVLSGLSPNIVMECAGRALSFWAYQTTQDIFYQQYLYKTLTEKYSALNVHLDKTVSDANVQIERLQGKLDTIQTEHEAARRKNDELAQKLMDKSRKLLAVQEQYDKAKRKAEMGNLQRAATDAVNSTLHEANQQAFNDLAAQNVSDGRQRRTPPFGPEIRFDQVHGMNTGMPRSQIAQAVDDSRWARPGFPYGTEVPAPPGNMMRQRIAHHSSHAVLGAQQPDSGLANGFNGPRRTAETHTSSLANNRAGLSGLGLTSGLKVSQPPNPTGLNVPSRYH